MVGLTQGEAQPPATCFPFFKSSPQRFADWPLQTAYISASMPKLENRRISHRLNRSRRGETLYPIHVAARMGHTELVAQPQPDVVVCCLGKQDTLVL